MPQEFVRIRWLANLKDGEKKKKCANTIHFKIVCEFFLYIFAVTFSELLSFFSTFMIESLLMLSLSFCKNTHFDKIIVCVADKEKLLTMLDH